MDDFVHVVFDQLLGACAGLFVELVVAHTAHIAVDALVEGEQQAHIVVTGTQAAQTVQPAADGGVIVELGLVHLAPALHTAGGVVFLRQRPPFLVGLGPVHLLVQPFEPAVLQNHVSLFNGRLLY